MTDREKLIEIRDLIDSHLSDDAELTASRVDGDIVLTWSGIDVNEIQWSVGEGKTHSLNWMWDDPRYDPPVIIGSSYILGDLKGYDNEFNITVGNGEWDEIDKRFIFNESISVTLPEIENPSNPIEPLDLFYGFWYDRHVPEESKLKQLCTVGQDRDDQYEDLKPIVDNGRKCIPTIGGFSDVNMSESALRQRIRESKPDFEKIGFDNIQFVNIRDEPTHMTKESMSILIDECKKQYSCPSTFMFTRGMLLRGHFPDNMTHVGCNVYPFFPTDAPDGYVQIRNYTDFRDHLDDIFDKVRSQIPGVKIIITAQTFYSIDESKFGIPPIESAEYYLKYASENPDIIGFLFWMWGLSKWIGLEHMPKLEQAWVEAIDRYSN